MISRRFVITAGVLVCALSAGPSLAKDVGGRFSDPNRIVAIGGSITEIVYALGEEKRLVARDSTSIYPKEAFSLPDVGYMRQLSPEGVLSVNPGGILALEGAGPPEAVETLKKAEVEYVEVEDRFDHAGILSKIAAVGTALGLEDKARELSAKVDADLKATEAVTKAISERKRVVFVLSFQSGKIMASGTDTAAAGIIALAGAENAVTGYTGYKPLTDEALLQAQPDFILMMDRGDHTAVVGELLAHPAVAATPAGKAGNVIRMDGAFLLGFGPRTASAARDLATRLYGSDVRF